MKRRIWMLLIVNTVALLVFLFVAGELKKSRRGHWQPVIWFNPEANVFPNANLAFTNKRGDVVRVESADYWDGSLVYYSKEDRALRFLTARDDVWIDLPTGISEARLSEVFLAGRAVIVDAGEKIWFLEVDSRRIRAFPGSIVAAHPLSGTKGYIVDSANLVYFTDIENALSNKLPKPLAVSLSSYCDLDRHRDQLYSVSSKTWHVLRQGRFQDIKIPWYAILDFENRCAWHYDDDLFRLTDGSEAWELDGRQIALPRRGDYPGFFTSSSRVLPYEPVIKLLREAKGKKPPVSSNRNERRDHPSVPRGG